MSSGLKQDEDDGPPSFPRFQTIPKPCLAFLENDSHQLVGRQPTPVLVRCLVVIATFSDPLTTRSQETTLH